MWRARRIFVLSTACAAALALASCGGDSGPSDSASGAAEPAFDPDTVVEQAAGPNRAARTGRIDAKVTLTLQGVPVGGVEVTFALQGVPAGYREFSAGVSGPYRYRKDASLPDYDLEIGARDYGVGLTSVAGRSYVSLGTTGYRLPADVRRRLVRSAAKGRNGLTRTLEQFGIAPWRWETERVAAGTARLDGVEVRHVTTGANVGRILRDANTLLGFMRSLGITRAIGLPNEIGPRARRAIVRSVTTFTAGSWVGTKDHVLRRSRFDMTFVVPKSRQAAVGGITRGRVAAELNVTQVGQAPADRGARADRPVRGLRHRARRARRRAGRRIATSDPRRRSSWAGGHRLRRFAGARPRDAAGRPAALAAAVGARRRAEGHAAEVRRRGRAARPA